ncbi:MAG: ribosome recycling factor [Gammaproteobacteria bacterium]|nr:ribosome recycling factor [Gammaproteobacteria bacterium]
MTINDVTTDAKTRMTRSIDALRQELSKVRTGRAHPSLLDHVRVSYYGSDMPLNQVANVSVQDARTLGVSPYDKGMVSAVEKAIRDSDLGLNPVTAGTLIRVPLPALTEERRRDLIKVVRHEAEAARVAVRNVRREANHALKELVKEKLVSEDQERRAEEEVQKLTDRFIAEVDKVLQAKESDLMEI